ncbi:MAG: BON domain-containing protein [Gammaproteobacteria bacterium]|nr:BON domain-containing protein [Gammaproteobacteria bacterium]
MKTYCKLWIIGVLLFSIVMMPGCNNSQDAEETAVSSTPIDTATKDSDITIKVKAALSNNEELPFVDITVVTRKGDVLLTGTVDNQNQIEQVKKLVLNIEGVQTLHNHLTVDNRRKHGPIKKGLDEKTSKP